MQYVPLPAPEQRRPVHIPTTLILGGARSGKSRHAEALLTAGPPPWTYVATAQAFDDEMRTRIADSPRRPRQGMDHGRGAARPARGTGHCPARCWWIASPCGSATSLLADHDPAPATAALLAALDRPDPTVLVSNEVGLSIVPDNALARRFRDAAGTLHQAIAARADRVDLVVAGIPMRLK